MYSEIFSFTNIVWLWIVGFVACIYIYKVVISVCLFVSFSDHNSGTPGLIYLKFWLGHSGGPRECSCLVQDFLLPSSSSPLFLTSPSPSFTPSSFSAPYIQPSFFSFSLSLSFLSSFPSRSVKSFRIFSQLNPSSSPSIVVFLSLYQF